LLGLAIMQFCPYTIYQQKMPECMRQLIGLNDYDQRPVRKIAEVLFDFYTIALVKRAIVQTKNKNSNESRRNC
jgi:hypothetical protein